MAESYLAGVKNALSQLVDELTEEDDVTPKQVKDRLWRFVEEHLKESFKNGKNTQTNGKVKAVPHEDATVPTKLHLFRRGSR